MEEPLFCPVCPHGYHDESLYWNGSLIYDIAMIVIGRVVLLFWVIKLLFF